MPNHKDSTPVKLYTPKGAIRAMLAGKVLEDAEGNLYNWDKEANNFVYFKTKDILELPEGENRCISYPVRKFTGLYDELEEAVI